MKKQFSKPVNVAGDNKGKRVVGSASYRRYRNATSELRTILRSSIPVETQKDIAYIINKIEAYGFDFFPNHYVYEDIRELEGIIAKLKGGRAE